MEDYRRNIVPMTRGIEFFIKKIFGSEFSLAVPLELLLGNFLENLMKIK